MVFVQPYKKTKEKKLEGPVRRTISGKIYVEEIYWQDTSINQTNQLPLDINSNCILEVPINTRKRFDSTKDGRHWGTLRENKRSGFNGDQYIDTYRDSFECHDENFPYLVEFKKVNRRQFNLKAICESCGHHSKRTSVKKKSFGSFLFPKKKCP